jgi:hypothetical protein
VSGLARGQPVFYSPRDDGLLELSARHTAIDQAVTLPNDIYAGGQPRHVDVGPIWGGHAIVGALAHRDAAVDVLASEGERTREVE